MGLLLAASDWGVPPWVITGESGITARIRWISRWSFYKKITEAVILDKQPIQAK